MGQWAPAVPVEADSLKPFLTFPAPKVCEACKTKNEDDNDIMETLCKNDFGK